MKHLILIFTMLSMSQIAAAQHEIIPAPVSYELTGATFELGDGLVIHVKTDDEMVVAHAQRFQEYMGVLGVPTDIELGKSPRRGAGALILSLDNSVRGELGTEGYLLEVSDVSILVSAAAPAGVFYGLQTLKQLLPAAPVNTADTMEITKIDGCRIRDYPRFQWRGLMLDVSRHFFPVADVKAYIDKMSEYKFNTFHWHLTDDQGWRIEIKSLPELTRVGAWRVERHGRFGEHREAPREGEEATYGGFYTHEDIREVVRYAAERNITIVPEIDMPGHSMAALAAYPGLSVNNEPKYVSPGSKFAEWYDDGSFEMMIENTLDPTDEAVYEFADKVFGEVAELFPGEYIHMGGDEAFQGFWEKDPGVQAFMEEMNIADTHALQSYFVNRIETIIQGKGKKLIGWDEILEGELSPESAVMSWRGMKGGVEAARRGHKVVMSPTTHAYLDYTQGDHSVENPIYADLSLERVYEFEPLPADVDPSLILGGQGNLWTEAIPNLSFAYYMTYPRAFALSEVLWSPVRERDWAFFARRTEDHFSRFDASGLNIAKTVLEPIVEVSLEEERLMCSISNSIPGTEVYYTIDNTYPPITGAKFVGPFELPEGNLSLRTQVYRDGQPLGRELIIPREVLLERASAQQ